MTRAIVVLRPEPGNARTAAAIAAMGLIAIRLPLFAVRPVAWWPPDPNGFDALLLTSANAVRHAGAGLAALAALPVVAVGEETAAAARATGLTVPLVGEAGVQAVVAAAREAGLTRLLHLAGRDLAARTDAVAITVYASDPIHVPHADVAPVGGAVALLHSARAARAFVALVDRERIDRATIRIAAISPAVCAAAGGGWGAAAAASSPSDDALLRLARDASD